MNTEQRTMICRAENFQTRAEDGNLYIEGYFAVFGPEYEMWDGVVERVDPGAFDETLGGDVRALINHDTTLVLGRTRAGTLTLRVDAYGLWGRVLINQADQDAMNLYERVKRGDVNQCSFGFEIVKESREERADGVIVYTLLAVRLWEVSVCTFPAYEETAVSARRRDEETVQRRKVAEWRAGLLKKIKTNKED